MSKKLVVVVIILQLGVLVYMAAQREYIHATGDILYFRTMPLDPRDPFRGDFVRLRYDINNVAKRHWQDRGDEIEKGELVYTTLAKGANNIAHFVSVSTKKPEKELDDGTKNLFIKGRVDHSWQFQRPNAIGVRYGIEQYFVQQGVGLDLEEKMGRRNEIQVPMEVEVAIGSDGTAVTRDFRWSKLGIKTEVLRAGANPLQTNLDPTTTSDSPVSPKIKITIQNVSDTALALVDNINHCAFELISSNWTDQDYFSASKLCDDYQPSTYGLVQLAPQQSHEIEFELSDPRWHVLLNNKATEIGTLESFPQFRLVYHSPTAKQVESMVTDNEIWLGELPSQAFNANGRID